MTYLVREASPDVIKDLIARLDVGYKRCCEFGGAIHYTRLHHSYMTRGLVLINEPSGTVEDTMLVHMFHTEPNGIDLILIDKWRDERFSKLLTDSDVKIVHEDTIRFLEMELGLSLPF